MTRRDWIALSFFVLAVVAAAVTVAIVLDNGIGGHGATPLDKRQVSFCYPNQGTGGC